MAETSRQTQYYEAYDFPAIISYVNGQELAIGETNFSDNLEENRRLAQGHLVNLVRAANSGLLEGGFLYADAILGEGRLMRDVPFQAFDRNGQRSDVLDGVFGDEADLVDGRYLGIAIMDEHFDSDSDVNLSRTQLMHRVQILDAKMEDPFFKQSTEMYAYLPLDNPNIEIFASILSSPPTEKALEAMTSGLVEEGVSPHFPSYNEAFKRVFRANITRFPLVRNVDWLFDRFELISGMKERGIRVASSGHLIQSGMENKIYRLMPNVVEGTFMGFCTMSTYKVQQLSDGTQKAIEDPDNRQLALCIEITNEGRRALAKVPVNNITELPEDNTNIPAPDTVQ